MDLAERSCFTYWGDYKSNRITGNQIKSLVFGERGKLEYQWKNLSEQSRQPTNSTHVWRRGRNRTRAHCWRASAVTTAPTLLINLQTTPFCLNELILHFSGSSMKMFEATVDPCRCDVLFASRLMVLVLLFDWTWNENSLRCMIVEITSGKIWHSQFYDCI